MKGRWAKEGGWETGAGSLGFMWTRRKKRKQKNTSFDLFKSQKAVPVFVDSLASRQCVGEGQYGCCRSLHPPAFPSLPLPSLGLSLFRLSTPSFGWCWWSPVPQGWCCFAVVTIHIMKMIILKMMATDGVRENSEIRVPSVYSVSVFRIATTMNMIFSKKKRFVASWNDDPPTPAWRVRASPTVDF